MDVHELVNSKNNDGNTILDMAVADQHVETIEFLTTSTRIIQVKVSQILKRNDAWLEKWSGALKLAAPPLIAAMAFLVGLSPFLASLMIILLLISGSPLIRRYLMCVLIVIISVAAIAIGLTYMLYVYGLTTYVALALAAPIIMLIGIGSIALLLLWHLVRLMIKMMKHFGTSITIYETSSKATSRLRRTGHQP
ncbi:hypothetical protein LWI29_016739 [Acer saccharum]|uniref:Ankyrin repeat protein n=1 Tax=Acer saccharum TaxID=4024 RepID=A0AA39RE52_ACESA|nr:hypothetical protein LWI29_016739 [Acer saccharum]